MLTSRCRQRPPPEAARLTGPQAHRVVLRPSLGRCGVDDEAHEMFPSLKRCATYLKKFLGIQSSQVECRETRVTCSSAKG